MKIYFPRDLCNVSYRRHIFPLLRPFLKEEGFTDQQRIHLYGISEKDIHVMAKIEDAQLCILPMSWNFYFAHTLQTKAYSFINLAEQHQKKVISINLGDYGVKIPFFENCIVLRTSGYASKATANEYAYPPFIEDPLKRYFATTQVFQPYYNKRPVIGFCGQANSSLLNAGKEIAKTGLRNFRYYIGLSREEPQQLLSTSYLRYIILQKLKKSPRVEDNFILRDKYRAGVTTNKSQHKTTHEFYENMKDSTYIVCVRGAGNFSIRFYEALAMGRIPVFVNTDCMLPLQDEINWKKHGVWVEKNELAYIDEKISSFHQQLNQQTLHELCMENRKLWLEKLSLKGFFERFVNQESLNK